MKLKRNTMLSIIRATIRNHLGRFDIEGDLEDLSEDILKTQEIMGMLPPDRGDGLIVGKQYMSTHLDYSRESNYEWEPENE